MINGVSRRKDIRVVAIFANVRRLDVGWTFPYRINAVVTAGAVIDNAEMIEIGWPPGDC